MSSLTDASAFRLRDVTHGNNCWDNPAWLKLVGEPSSSAKHLPGRHDQSDHGRRRGSRVTAVLADAAEAVAQGAEVLAAVPVDLDRMPTDAPNHRALMAYRTQGFRQVNDMLRGEGMFANNPVVARIYKPQTDEWIRAVDDTMAHSRLERDVEVFRGLQVAESTLGPREDWPDSFVGRTWTDRGFVSTTSDQSVAAVFAEGGQVLLRIHAPKGTGAIRMSGGQYEAEVLLDRGLTFRVVGDSSTEDTGRTLRQLDVEIVPADDSGPKSFKHLPGLHDQLDHAGLSAIHDLDIFDTDSYETEFGDITNDASVDLGEGTRLSARIFDSGTAHLALDLPAGHHQVLGDLYHDQGMRDLAGDLDRLLAVDFEDFDESDEDDNGLVDANTGYQQEVLTGLYRDGDIRVASPHSDDHLVLDRDQAEALSLALAEMADQWEIEFGGEDTKDGLRGSVKHPGHPDQSVHGRRRGVHIPSPPKPGGEPVATPPKAPRDLSSAEADELQDKMLADNPPPWTPRQRKALRDYSSNAFSLINGTLRGGRKLDPRDDKELLTQIRHTNDAMRPTAEPMKVYRNTDFRALGIKTFNRTMVNQELRGLRGKKLQDPGFVSTSVERDVIADDKPVKLEIEVPAGTPAAYVRRVSHFKHEKEWVLGPGLKYEIVSIDGDPRKDPSIAVKVRVVPS